MQPHREHPPLHRRAHFSVVVAKRGSAELALPIIPTVVVAEKPGVIHGRGDFRVDEIHPDASSVALRGASKCGAKYPPVAA